MKLISWNVNGLRAVVGKNFIEEFGKLNADIFCLQETKLQAGQIEMDLPGYFQYWNYAERKGYSGTAVFTRQEPLTVTYGLGIPEHDTEGRVITLEFSDFYLVNVYTPNSQNELKRLDYRMTWEDAFRAYLTGLAEKKGVPLIIMEPIKGGSLACFAEDITSMFRKLEPNASTASFALRWVGTLPNVKVILSGMSTMEQVEDNLKTFENFKPLSSTETKAIEDIVALINSRVQNGCTGCRYCMPCPAGVDIPGNFCAWNTYHMYQNYNVVSWQWEKEIGESKQAKNCIKCGKCEQLCPQKLSIRKDLEKVQADLEKKEFIL